MQALKKFFEAYWFPVICIGILLVLAAGSNIRSCRERQRQERYEKERQEILNQEKPLIQQSQSAQKDAAVSAVISQERTNEITKLQADLSAIRRRLLLAQDKSLDSGTGQTLPSYAADLGELRRLCQRANSLSVNCDLSKFSDQ